MGLLRCQAVPPWDQRRTKRRPFDVGTRIRSGGHHYFNGHFVNISGNGFALRIPDATRTVAVGDTVEALETKIFDDFAMTGVVRDIHFDADWQVLHCEEPAVEFKSRWGDVRQALSILLYPHHHFERIEEKVTLHGLAVHRTVRLEISSAETSVPWIPATKVWVPISIVDRGTHLDNLVVACGDGRPLHVANHLEHRRFMFALLCAYLEQKGYPEALYRRRDLSSGSAAVAAELIRKTLNLAFASNQRVGPQREQLLSDANVFARYDFGLATDVASRLDGSSGLRFLLDVAGRFPIFVEAEVNEGSRIEFQYEYDAFHLERILEDDRTWRDQHWLVRLRDRITKAAGLRPPNAVFFLGRGPALCKNFTFQMEAPSGFYRYESIFLHAPRASPAGPEPSDFDPITAIPLEPLQHEILVPDPLDRAMGNHLPYVHMYLGGCTRRDSRLFARVRFFERPPGSLGLARYSSIILLLVMILLGVFFKELVRPSDASLAAVPAILIGIPGLYALWLAPRQPSSAVTSRPVSALLSFLATGVASLLAALVLIISSASYSVVVWHGAPWTITAATVGWACWIIVTVGQLGAFVVVNILYRFARANYYFDLDNLHIYAVERLMFKVIGRDADSFKQRSARVN